MQPWLIIRQGNYLDPPAGGFRGLLAFWIGGATQEGNPPPPPTPSSGGGDGGGGFGWIATEAEWLGLKRLRELLAERREADQAHLRAVLHRVVRGESPELGDAVAETVAPVVDLTADEIDWEPLFASEEATARLEARVAMMLSAAEVNFARQARMEREAAERADEEDIELLLLTIN